MKKLQLNLNIDNLDQVTKFGALGESGLVGSYWILTPRQEMVPYFLPTEDLIYFVLTGTGVVYTFDKTKVSNIYLYTPRPNETVIPSSKYKDIDAAVKSKSIISSNEIFHITPGVMHSICNESKENLVLFSVHSNTHNCVYTSR